MAGLVMIGYGCYLLSPAFGYIVGGLFLLMIPLLVAINAAIRERKDNQNRLERVLSRDIH